MAGTTQEFNNEFIKQIGLGVGISRTYPKGHPSLLPVIQRLKVLLKEIPLEKESLSLVVIEDVLMIEEERFDARRLPMVKSLVDRFNQLDIKSITFNVDLSDNDIKEFLAATAATPAEINDYGDIVALIKAHGIIGIKVNKFRVGVISSDQDGRAINWDTFLESIVVSDTAMSDEQRFKELSKFLAGVGISGAEPANIQSENIVGGLEKLALMIADQYGEGRWDEYSIVFSRILSVLSPNIKKNIVRYKTENKKLAMLFKSLIPTMNDEDIVDIVAMKAKEKKAGVEEEVLDILKNVTGSRLPDILSSLRMNVPELNFEKIVGRLMSEMKTSKGSKEADKFVTRDLEVKLRNFFPKLRDPHSDVRIAAIEELVKLSPGIFQTKNWDLLRLLVDRLDTMADAETEIPTFTKVIDALKDLYTRSVQLKNDDMTQFISKKFGKHLMRKEPTLRERKKIVISAIAEIKDQNYITEMVSMLWDQGTFIEAREAIITFSEFSTPLLIDTLKDIDDRSIRMKILDILVRIGEKAVPEVKKMLGFPEWFIRRNGVWLLGEIKSAAVVDDLGKLITDEEERVQLEVVEALVKLNLPAGKPYLNQGLNSKFRAVVVASLRTADRANSQTKIPEVLGWIRIRKGIPDEKEEKFRQSVIAELEEIGDDRVIPAFNEILNEKSLFKGDLLLATKQAILDAYLKINTPNTLQALRDATKHRDAYVAGMAQEIVKRLDAGRT
jgi:HEAT repeat protein